MTPTDTPTPPLRSSRALALAACLAVLPLSAAQAQPAEAPSNVVSLSASGQMDVPQDWLSVHLNTVRDGADPVTVQNQLKQALDAALAQAQPEARAGQLEVRTGTLRLQPRYGSNGKINGWQGQTELFLEGRDIAGISALAGRMQTLSVAGMGFSLSREARRTLESQVQAMAIERFRARASEIAKGFGFAGYTLREVSVGSVDQPERPYLPRAMAMEAKAAMSDAPVPVAAGTTTVTVNVNGSIQLR